MKNDLYYRLNGHFKDQRFAFNGRYRKYFDFVDHQFLITVLGTFGFEKNLVR